jgi:hypothetical protein
MGRRDEKMKEGGWGAGGDVQERQADGRSARSASSCDVPCAVDVGYSPSASAYGIGVASKASHEAGVLIAASMERTK